MANTHNESNHVGILFENAMLISRGDCDIQSFKADGAAPLACARERERFACIHDDERMLIELFQTSPAA